MNKSNLFKAAHAMTKQVIKSGDSYSVTFGLCLKQIINDTKKASTMKTITFTANELTATKSLVARRADSYTEAFTPFHNSLTAKLEALQPDESLEVTPEYLRILEGAYMFIKVCYPSMFGKYEQHTLDKILALKG